MILGPLVAAGESHVGCPGQEGTQPCGDCVSFLLKKSVTWSCLIIPSTSSVFLSTQLEWWFLLLKTDSFIQQFIGHLKCQGTCQTPQRHVEVDSMVRMVLASGKTSALGNRRSVETGSLCLTRGQGQPLKKEGIFYRWCEHSWMPLWGGNEPWFFLTPHSQ